jgi:purine-nucleoside phosphorylase
MTMTARDYQAQVEESVRFLKARISMTPEWGIILGTGQTRLSEQLTGGGALDYADIPYFPRSTSPSHRGRLHWGKLAGRAVLVFHGRFHAYEGYHMRQVTFPIRVLAGLGGRGVILTNAAGGLNPEFAAGDLMLITDHLNLMGDNPLVGENVDAWGLRFPDMSRVYDRDLGRLAAAIAAREGLPLRQGVYVAIKGPSLETPAETRFLRMSGADAVGMSTVPEAICAVHAGLKILGVSVISNVNRPEDMEPISIEAVIAGVAAAEQYLVRLLLGVLERAD